MKVTIIAIFLANLFAFESSFIPTPAQYIPKECSRKCLTPYGAVLGTFDGVPGYSNCNDNCINFDDDGVVFTKNDTGFIEDVYVGVRWQCVEYARRYLITKRHVSFESIDAAYQIFTLSCLQDLTQPNSFARFLGFANGARVAPQIGDLLIFAKTNEAPYGHVSVVAGIDLKKGYVEMAEQNINTKWEKRNLYSRRITIFTKNGTYFVQDSAWNKNVKLNVFSQEKANEVIGWKRVGEFGNSTAANSLCPV